MSSRTTLARTFPVLVAVPLACVAFFPDSLNPGVVTLAGLVLGGALCVMGAFTSRRSFSLAEAGTMLATAATAIWFVLASRWAISPSISLSGLAGQNNGAALWVLVAVWLLAGVFCADARAVRQTLATVSALSMVYVAAALFEAATGGAERRQGYAAGFFENSTSAGEMFALALLVALTGAVISKQRLGRILYASAMVIAAAGLIQSSSRTGALGLLAVGGFAALIYFLPAQRPRPAVLGVGASAAAFVLTATMLAASVGWLGQGASGLIARLGTDRDLLWSAAWAHLQRAPLIGSGLEQFSTLISWSLASGRMTFQATADPHNIILAAAIGGGVVGVALLLAAIAALLTQGVSMARSAKRERGVTLIASYPAFILGAGLVGWIAPAVALTTAAIVGAAFGAAGAKSASTHIREERATVVVKGATVLVGIGALLIGLLSLGTFAANRQYVHSKLPGQPGLSPTALAALYERHPDPRIPADALDLLTPALQSGSSDAVALAEKLIAMSEADVGWSSTLAMRQLVAAQALESRNPELFSRFERIAREAAKGDPTSGAWYTFAALEAARLGLKDLSVTYARKALELPVGAAERALLERVLAQ